MVTHAARRMLPVVVTLSALIFRPVAHAQAESTRLEVSMQFSTIRLSTQTSTKPVAGFGGRVDVNLTRRFALEAQLDFFPQTLASFPQFQGGKTLRMSSGVRGKFFQTKHLSVYGLMHPGLMHFTNAITSESATLVPGTTNQFIISAQRGQITHFMVDLGGGVEFYLTPRWLARIEMNGDLYRTPDTLVSQPTLPSGLRFAPIPGGIENTWGLSVGVNYRVGTLVENEKEAPVTGRLEFGPQFSTIILPSGDDILGTRTEPGFGGFLSYELHRYIFADAAMTFFPKQAASTGPHDGGRLMQGVYGLKAGIQRNHAGFFVKARPGFHSYSQTLSSVTLPPQPVSLGYTRSTNFVLDLGGVVEVYVGKHTLLRLDAGDMFLFFGTRPITFAGQTFQVSGGPHKDSIQFSAGYGWRF
jgi:hypothetical protein